MLQTKMDPEMQELIR